MGWGGEGGGRLLPAVAHPHGVGLPRWWGHCLPGGEGKPGRVVDIRGWDGRQAGVASVTWADGTTNVYRVGHKGKVGLRAVARQLALLLQGAPPKAWYGQAAHHVPPRPPHLPSVLPWAWGWSPAAHEVSGAGRRNCLEPGPAAPPPLCVSAELQRRVSADGQPFPAWGQGQVSAGHRLLRRCRKATAGGTPDGHAEMPHW